MAEDVSLGLRLLELQQEYAKHAENAGLAAEFRRPDWLPRSVEEIAAEYAATLQALMRPDRTA